MPTPTPGIAAEQVEELAAAAGLRRYLCARSGRRRGYRPEIDPLWRRVVQGKPQTRQVLNLKAGEPGLYYWRGQQIEILAEPDHPVWTEALAIAVP